MAKMQRIEITSRRSKIASLAVRALLLIQCFVVIYPVFWSVCMSLKPNSQFFQDIWGLPKEFAFDNYIRAWQNSHVGDYFFNSVFVTVVSTVAIMGTCIPLSYVLGRYVFKGRGVIKALVVSGLLFPSMTALISQYLMLSKVNLLDSYVGLILIYVAVSVPFSVFMLTGFFSTIPRELEEAARLDGCGYTKTMWKIMVPMAKPGIIMVTVLNVLSIWNEYSIALTLIRDPNKRTMAIGITSMLNSQTQYTDWGALFAGVCLLMGMSFIIYVLFQRQIRGSVTLGALK